VLSISATLDAQFALENQVPVCKHRLIVQGENAVSHCCNITICLHAGVSALVDKLCGTMSGVGRDINYKFFQCQLSILQVGFVKVLVLSDNIC
jgi:hypothetical protein